MSRGTVFWERRIRGYKHELHRRFERGEDNAGKARVTAPKQGMQPRDIDQSVQRRRDQFHFLRAQNHRLLHEQGHEPRQKQRPEALTDRVVDDHV